MLPRADIIMVNPVGAADPASSLEGAADARQEIFQRSLAGLLGKSLQGEVLSRLTDGSFIVKVAGAAARMQLPPGAKVGAQVPLTLVALSPRPTFELRGGQGEVTLAHAEAGPALTGGPYGSAARAALVYGDGGEQPQASAAARPAAAPQTSTPAPTTAAPAGARPAILRADAQGAPLPGAPGEPEAQAPTPVPRGAPPLVYSEHARPAQAPPGARAPAALALPPPAAPGPSEADPAEVAPHAAPILRPDGAPAPQAAPARASAPAAAPGAASGAPETPAPGAGPGRPETPAPGAPRAVAPGAGPGAPETPAAGAPRAAPPAVALAERAPQAGGAARANPPAAALLGAPGARAASAAPASTPDSASGTGAAAPRALSHAAALLSKAPIIAIERLPPIDPKSTPALLSEVGRVLTGVLASAPQGGQANTPIIATAPLADTPAIAPEQLAAALKAAVGKSGLFYESHVAEWSEGQRTIAELRQEPQMLRAPAQDALAGTQGADPAMAQLINQQLVVQEQARVAWQGQLWPGQDLQWEIRREAPEGGEREAAQREPQAPLWRSGLRLRFALLGELEASVVISGQQLHIRLEAGSGEIGGVLRAHAGALEAAMQAAGVPLSSFNIALREADHG